MFYRITHLSIELQEEALTRILGVLLRQVLVSEKSRYLCRLSVSCPLNKILATSVSYQWQWVQILFHT